MIALPSLTEYKGFSCEPSRVKGYPMRETTKNAEPDTRTDVDSSANILASAGQKLSSAFWRAADAFRAGFPYLCVVVLSALALVAPHSAFLVLAVIHLAAIDAIKKPKRDAFSAWLERKAVQLDRTKKFVGDDVSVTNEQTWRINGKRYLVSVTHSDEVEDAGIDL